MELAHEKFLTFQSFSVTFQEVTYLQSTVAMVRVRYNYIRQVSSHDHEQDPDLDESLSGRRRRDLKLRYLIRNAASVTLSLTSLPFLLVVPKAWIFRFRGQ